MTNVSPVARGSRTRMSFGKIKEVMEMPNLIEIQKDSYRWFLETGLKEVFRDIADITDYTGNWVLKFVDYRMDDKPKYTIRECKERDASYSAPMRVKARLLNKETGVVKESEVYMGDFPIMTDSGTFIINGAERAIVSQLVRSPGVYYDMTHDKTGIELYSNTVIPNRGAWLEYETDVNDLFYVRIDKNRKIFITTFIRALGLSSNTDIREFFGYDPRLEATLERDETQNTEEALMEVFKKLRPGEPATLETAQTHLDNLFFDPYRYDISRVGRYKYNKKLSLFDRIVGATLSQPVIAPLTGELLAEEGEVVSKEKAIEIEQAGVNVVFVKVDDDKEIKVISNGMVDIKPYFPQFTEDQLDEIGINERVSFSVLKEILEADVEDDNALLGLLKDRCDDLIPKHITIDDIFSSINYVNSIAFGIGRTDDIDHLGNRRIRCVGELLQNQFRIGLARMERVVRERMTLQAQEDDDKITPQTLINIRPVLMAIKEFFGSSPLSQFMDQTNPLAELTHKRRLSALGPGGLSRDRAGFEVRDVHYSHYGRMCPIETPEGPNIGLISYLATFAKINKYGFIEAPYRRVVDGKVLDEVVYMTADQEDEFIVAQANEPLDEEGHFVRRKVMARYRDEFHEIDNSRVSFMDVSPKMLVSVATAMIPFLENDDANRALMGSNMQRQAVPLLRTEAPIVGTGMEYKAAVDSGTVVLCKKDGVVVHVNADYVEIQTADGIDRYNLTKFMRSNQGTCINQKPIVDLGQEVKKGDVIADGPATDHGEISLGKNALIGFMTWEGYNYEDAVLINEKLVRDDVYTSIHIEEFEIEARDTKLGPEEITRDIPNVGDDALKDLDDRGIIRVGAEVRSGDILVGKVTPKGETELTPEERLLRAIFGEKAKEVRDTSLRVPHGEYGIIVNVEVFTRENSDELSPGVNKVVRCYIAQKRKLSVGDKMAGRHGNKGVVSRILPQEDMPFLEDGTPLDIVLNPLGVPSRMNIGQVLEVNLGFAAKHLGWRVMTPVFDGAHESDIKEMFKELGIREDGKSILTDGRTGRKFDNPVTVGIMYYLKLLHLVDDKIHARSTGPYSLVTQQPLGGKAQFGGQRFGEMEVWAL
ncbi:MAG TPA: DNA-directed RNA polymerase subunit beta, partial [Ruminococcaceae bacterium]|nr:DNA-directed RNA polymerase subunit beta [Oscillospiraceae bacterium]